MRSNPLSFSLPSNDPRIPGDLMARLVPCLHALPISQPQRRWRLCWIEKFLHFVSTQPQLRQEEPLLHRRDAFIAAISEAKPRTAWILAEIAAALELLFSIASEAEVRAFLKTERPRKAPAESRQACLSPGLGSPDSAVVSSPAPLATASAPAQSIPVQSPKLLDRVRAVIRAKHYSPRTEQAYVFWTRKFIFFHQKRHPQDMGTLEVAPFLEHLAVNKNVAASTQNQALNALIFLYGKVLAKPLGDLGPISRAKRPKRLPTVLTQSEVHQVLTAMTGEYRLMARLLYGSGLRLLECVTLRIKDVHFESSQILVRDGKGFKDRVTMLPEGVQDELREAMARVKIIHDNDLKAGHGRVTLPYALSRKYPNLARSWQWQYIFPAQKLIYDAEAGFWRRHHVHEDTLQRAVKMASDVSCIGCV